MNALIALLHFCEVHGPCVVYCTQTIHKTPSLTTSSSDINIPALKSLSLSATTDHNTSSNNHETTDTPPTATANTPIPPPIIIKNSLSNTGPPLVQQQQQKSTSSGSCPACTAQLPLVNNGQMVTEAKSLYTLDEDDPSIKYIGTKAPQQNHLYKAVRLACVRR